MCTTALRMSLAVLRLHHGRRSGNADPELAAVAGATPVSACLARHQGGSACARHAPSPAGVAPGQGSLAGRPRAPLRGGGSPVRRPGPRQACPRFRKRTSRGAADSADLGRRCFSYRERRAWSWRSGSLGFGKPPVRETRARSLPRPEAGRNSRPGALSDCRALQSGLRPTVYDDAKDSRWSGRPLPAASMCQDGTERLSTI